MEQVMKQYIERNGQTLKVGVYYDLGGCNPFTYKNEMRGYYISVIPVERKIKDGYTSEKSKAYSGIKKLLVEVKRKSKKAETQALELATEELIEELIAHVLKKEEATVATV
ncbi:hypothetical protein AAGG74_16550 [Bacillus mexicanus]|uniref:hypothetical protein n=1 Tax=Bacillus mexicanus TaxID=2834415 RepID=UPI003D1D1A6E